MSSRADAEHEPSLRLPQTVAAPALAGGTQLGRPFVGRPFRILADQVDLVRPEAGLFEQLTPGSHLGRFAGVDAALGQLPRAR